MKQPHMKYLRDYKAPEFSVDSVDLSFELAATETKVHANIKFRRHADHHMPLILDGKALTLESIKINGSDLSKDAFQLTTDQLIIHSVPEAFNLETVVTINPQDNTTLTGLFQSNNKFCTQCEAEGFRRITYYLDRPDVMSHFTTTIIADKKAYPNLLSNGNLIKKGDLDNHRHFATWHDPFKKPSYLFALVAGDFDVVEDRYHTMNARQIQLKIYVDKGNHDKAYYAMTAIKHAMEWDEKVFAREYDLDIYMIVAINDFNMGAMENKGLNIFNAKYVLANTDIATDTDYEAILGVIGHEYFHNWSGNRITCRDWFQLSLKEGLTIFRDQEFTADMTSRPVKRIKDVKTLRTFQFPEDAGPLSHPVQPDSYLEIDNFYTHTIYEKGAEVIRMMQTLLGKEKFAAGMQLYFEVNDGKAVTIEEFVKAMETAGNIDLAQFRLWYKQAGTPKLTINTQYDPATQTYTLLVTQTQAATADQTEKKPLHIPLTIGLISATGEKMKDSTVLEIKKSQETFTFHSIQTKPILSVLHDFSAPVIIDMAYTEAELATLMTKDSNTFSQWEAGQRYIQQIFFNVVKQIQNQQTPHVPEMFVQAYQENLLNTRLDPSFVAELIQFPSEKYLLELLTPINVEQGHQAYQFIRNTVVSQLGKEIFQRYETYLDNGIANVHERKLKNVCLGLIATMDTEASWLICETQYLQATNMTDRIAALHGLVNSSAPKTQHILEAFFNRFKDETLVIDKWLTLQATADQKNVFENVVQLTKHPLFNFLNPNKVRSLIAAFCSQNLFYFHRRDGLGHAFLADTVLRLNQTNPQLAARLLEPLTHWRNYSDPQKNSMHDQLVRIRKAGELKSDVYEIVMKSL